MSDDQSLAQNNAQVSAITRKYGMNFQMLQQQVECYNSSNVTSQIKLGHTPNINGTSQMLRHKLNVTAQVNVTTQVKCYGMRQTLRHASNAIVNVDYGIFTLSSYAQLTLIISYNTR
ncbi:hypothetical protein F8M41_024783 [Gigaspora margarita]|uniref:Uncharacterized protein n=1 Tax=Gigaspora margarita TaxID=4874 RepID=A0A8H4AAM1_GIGMA|nr:hypothetical protein F8M41_024783 [Gigaspora margarita]